MDQMDLYTIAAKLLKKLWHWFAPDNYCSIQILQENNAWILEWNVRMFLVFIRTVLSVPIKLGPSVHIQDWVVILCAVYV